MKQVKMAVIGSRSITNHEAIWAQLDAQLAQATAKDIELIIVSGGARGVDRYAADWAKARGLIVVIVEPAWQRADGSTDRSAGFKRNSIIWDIADCGIAFWDGVSTGTQHSFELAKERNKKLVVIDADELPW